MHLSYSNLCEQRDAGGQVLERKFNPIEQQMQIVRIENQALQELLVN
jgi:hypothetical protein